MMGLPVGPKKSPHFRGNCGIAARTTDSGARTTVPRRNRDAGKAAGDAESVGRRSAMLRVLGLGSRPSRLKNSTHDFALPLSLAPLHRCVQGAHHSVRHRAASRISPPVAYHIHLHLILA
jgi:hypothetical protein